MQENKLRPIGFFDSKNYRKRFLYMCECGNFKIAVGGSRKPKTCGCWRFGNKNTTKHGMSHTRFYKCWADMWARCSDENRPDFFYYGERGIGIYFMWKDFEVFRDDMFDSYNKHVCVYGEKNTTLDRIDNDGNYTPNNCRWATREIQVVNSSQTREFEAFRVGDGYREIAISQGAFSRKYGLSGSAISGCLNGKLNKHKGWTFFYI